MQLTDDFAGKRETSPWVREKGERDFAGKEKERDLALHVAASDLGKKRER